MSTTNWAIALTTEIDHMLTDEGCNHDILQRKIRQLGLINQGLVTFYLSAACFTFSGFLGALLEIQHLMQQNLIIVLISLGMLFLLLGTSLLILYAFRALRIKRQQFEERLG